MKQTTKKLIAVISVLLLAALTLGTVASAAEPAGAEEELIANITAPFQPLIDTFVSFSPETFLTANLGNTFTWVVAVIALVGLLEALFGYKLLRFELILAGFGLGVFLGDLLLSTGVLASLLTEEWMTWVFLGIVGILVAFLAFKLFRVALFCSVAFEVFLIGRGVIAAYIENEIAVIVIAVVAGLLLGLLAVKLLRTVVILETSAIGAYFVSFALSGFIPIDHIGVILLGLVFLIGAATQIGMAVKNRY